MPRILFISTLLFLASCTWFESSEEVDDIVARVDDKFLFKSDLQSLNVQGISEEDSLQITKNYIQKWIRQQLVLRKAELNLSDIDTEIDDLVERYRNSLIRNRYETELIRQYLDTTVQLSELEEYYSMHLNDFELKENILRFKLVKIDPDAPRLDEFREIFPPQSEDEEIDVEDYVLQFAVQSYLKDSIWISFDELRELCPIEAVDEINFLKKTELIELQDTSFVYFLNISEYRMEESYSPLSYVQTMIRKLILHQRKLDLIERMEEDVYRDGEEKGIIEIYE